MIFKDDRGILHSINNIPFVPKQILISKSKKGTLRGLHQSPYKKWIYCIEGHIIDFFIDNEMKENVIDLLPGQSICIEANNAHGFYALEKSRIIYLLENEYDIDKDINIYWNSPEFTFNKQIPKPIYISTKDENSYYKYEYDICMIGSNGYLGSYLLNEFKKNNMKVLTINNRLSEIENIDTHIKKSRCKYFVCAAGISGRPTIEWCEDNKEETWNVNYLDMLNLLKCCKNNKVHLTILGSGLIYKADMDNQIFNEEDKPNYTDKIYSKLRIQLEESVKLFDNVLYLRILYPATLDGHQKCFVSKVKTRANNIHNISVPMTIVPSLFPIIPDMLNKNIVGIFNFVNEGNIKLPNILNYYKVDSNIIETNDKSYILDINKLKSYGYNIENINNIFKIK
jgi:3,5-epimerase/4-reductase